MGKRHPVFIETKEKVAHIKKKPDGSKSVLKTVRRADDPQMGDTLKLEYRMEPIDEEKRSFETEVAS